MAQPANDACTNAQLLTSAVPCAVGNLRDASGPSTSTSSIASVCGGATSPDVWYRFVAQTSLPTVTLSSMGNNMKPDAQLQIFSAASCAVATLNANSYGCASPTGNNSLSLTPSTALTVGESYFVRVFTGAANVSAGNVGSWKFDICIEDPATANNLCAGAIPMPYRPRIHR